MKVRYNTPEEIRAEFIKDGWNSDIDFEEVTREHGGNGKKFFRMVSTGNVFDDTGSIVYYNIKPLKEPICIAVCR